MATKLPYPSRTARNSDVFQTPGARYDLTQEAAADAYNDMLRARVMKDTANGRAKDPMYGVADARELETRANTPERGFGPLVAKRELAKRSEEGEFAAPGTGDLGQFAGGSGGGGGGGGSGKPRFDEEGVSVEAFKRGGKVKKMASGGMTSKVSSASKRADGIAVKGKTRGKMY
jgi:hypothetical protein